MTGNDPGQLIDLATEAVTLLARDLAGQEERVLVLVDDFHLLAWRPLGDWVLRWLVGIRGADIVITHLSASAGLAPPWPSRAVTLPLGNLSRDEVRRYLASRDQVGPDVAADVIEPVWEFTGGHPQALVLVADLMRESRQPANAVRAIRQVGAQEGELADKLEELVERIFRAIDATELRHALYSLCVTRYFDLALMTRLLNTEKAHAETLIEQMRQFSFVTEGGTQGFLTVSPFVRRIGQGKHTDGSRRGEIHAAAAEYFLGLIRKEVDEDQNWAQAWYRLEDRRFQALEKEWLYHVSQLTGWRRRAGRLNIARLFLDGFWWWGCYVPFPFCKEILADWAIATAGDTQESKEDREWAQALRGVYDTYPRGNRLEMATRPQLITVRRYLRQLWDLGGLGNQEDNAEARHVRSSPDSYTNAFQQEMIDRCMERMAELNAAAGDGEEALAMLRGAAARIRAFFGAYWEEIGGDEVTDVAASVVRALDGGVPAAAACVLFPALAPEVDTDLTRAGTEWELICHDVLWEMRGELDALPGTPLPPAVA